ncbi:hypothetical protein Tcan_12606 [Toxocara canis]|uniref:Ground-like domain-containing protein n=1 Tax=Toxocara canis TaxID=6265 RepID=A0A0B2V0X2_TOXCA|nr:hypothetical protein Tcan_12606 [Toxocara canis]
MIDCNPSDKCVVKRDASDNVGITVAEVIDEGKCNNDALREIMLEHMSQNVREAKIEIMRAAEAKLGGHFNVICARGDFSYITTTRLYCLQSVADINCYAFLADIQRTENMPEPHKPRTRAHCFKLCK